MESIIQKAIQSVQESEKAITKYITANDTGTTGGHQSGFHIHKNSWQLFFDTPGIKGQNKDIRVNIKWQDDFETESRVIYYGSGTRDEYRLTRFGKNFPYLEENNIGNLLIIRKKEELKYEAFILDADEEIDAFLLSFNISPGDIGGMIPKQFQQSAEEKLLSCFAGYLKSTSIDFPTTIELASNARTCYNSSYAVTPKIIKAQPDKHLLKWVDAEFELFKTFENDRYLKIIKKPFQNVEQLVEMANTILNRRKSRAGKSLELHLAEVFKTFELKFDSQKATEDNKKPDFLFPGYEAYSNKKFNSKKLVVLASKTTCKDRWRQVLNEADRIKTKHLFTLQQGISANQLKEMYKYNVCLVVPKKYIDSFPKDFRSKILTLEKFIQHVQSL